MTCLQDNTSRNSISTASAPTRVGVRRGRCLTLFFLAALFALAAALAVNFDAKLSVVFRALDVPGDLRKAIDLSEVFAHGAGAAAILGSILFLASSSRPLVWHAILITLVSGLVANGLKNCFARVRPHSQAILRIAGDTIADPMAADGGVLEVVEPSFWDARQRSFPSGHAATAWGLAIGLSLIFPRGLALFVCFATLACFQRLTSGAHFPSDVLAGASVALVCAALVFMHTERAQYGRASSGGRIEANPVSTTHH